jgi:hypothetical protein
LTLAAVLTVLVLILLSVAVYRRAPRETAPERPNTVEGLVARASELAAEKDKLGAELLQVLIDKKQSDADRGQAARALGKLRYRPAFTKLIEFIELEDSAETSLEIAPIEAAYPCVAALTDCGLEAIPQVLEAYFKEHAPGRLHLLRAVLGKKNAKHASIYAQGMAFDKDDSVLKRRVRELMRELRTESAEVTWPPKWPEP